MSKRLMTGPQYNAASIIHRASKPLSDADVTDYGIRVALRGLIAKGFVDDGRTLVDPQARYTLSERGMLAYAEEEVIVTAENEALMARLHAAGRGSSAIPANTLRHPVGLVPVRAGEDDETFWRRVAIGDVTGEDEGG